jgi:hypothetical protein
VQLDAKPPTLENVREKFGDRSFSGRARNERRIP